MLSKLQCIPGTQILPAKAERLYPKCPGLECGTTVSGPWEDLVEEDDLLVIMLSPAEATTQGVTNVYGKSQQLVPRMMCDLGGGWFCCCKRVHTSVLGMTESSMMRGGVSPWFLRDQHWRGPNLAEDQGNREGNSL